MVRGDPCRAEVLAHRSRDAAVGGRLPLASKCGRRGASKRVMRGNSRREGARAPVFRRGGNIVMVRGIVAGVGGSSYAKQPRVSGCKGCPPGWSAGSDRVQCSVMTRRRASARWHRHRGSGLEPRSFVRHLERRFLARVRGGTYQFVRLQRIHVVEIAHRGWRRRHRHDRGQHW